MDERLDLLHGRFGVIGAGERTGVPTPMHRVVTALIDAFDWRVFRRMSARRPPLS